MTQAKQVITPTFRVSYPHVFKPQLNKLNNKLEYSVVALFPKGASLKDLELAVIEVLTEKWGEGKVVEGAPHKNGKYYWKTAKANIGIRLPFRDQNERADAESGSLPNGYEDGAKFVTLKSQYQPPLVDQKRQDIIEETEFYAGCYARAAVNAFAYDQVGNKGVSLGLQALQKVKDGEPLVTRINAQTAFSPVEDAETGDAESLFGGSN